jgi:flagellin-specific chaperone FliS
MAIDIESYTARIASATPLQLLIINYEIALDYIVMAMECRDEQVFKHSTEKSVTCIEELMNSLDMKQEISKTLLPIYIYVNKILNTALYKNNLLEDCVKILKILLDGWNELEKNDTSSNSVLKTSQKIYAGLTYKNGKLEEYIGESTGKTYNA